MANLSNAVNPLFANVPIVNPDGTPTYEFMRKWAQQAATNASIPNLTTAVGVSEILDLIGNTIGDLLVRGTFTWGVLPPNTAGFVLTDGGAGATATWQKPHYIPAGGTAGQVLEKNSGTDYDVSWQTPTGGAPASCADNGTLYFSLVDSNGQLVLDGSGDPIYIAEVLPPSSLPLATSAAFGAVKVDGFSIQSVAGMIGTLFSGFVIQPGNQTYTADGTYHTFANVGAATIDTQGGYTALTGLFKPTKAGKYFVFVFGYSGNNGVGTIAYVDAVISKNGNVGSSGTLITLGRGAPMDSSVDTSGLSAVGLTTMNGSTDTLELDLNANISGGTTGVLANGGWGAIYLGA